MTEVAAASIPWVERILIRAPNWLGDAVMALPAMAAVRAALPDARLAVAAVSTVAPMFLENTSVRPAEVLTVDRGVEPRQLAAGRFDAVLLLPNSLGSAWAARRAGIRILWGYGGPVRRLFLTRSVPRPRRRVHQAEYYLQLTRGLGFPDREAAPRIDPTADTRQRASALLDRHGVLGPTPIVGIAPGAAYGHAKRWPPPRVAELVGRLARERAATCVLVGAVADRSAAREIESALPPATPLVNLVGRTDLRLLLGVISKCDAFVSNDSGAMHLAAAVGLPVTAIFGPTDERVTAPVGDHDILVHDVFCRPCMLRDCPIDHRCMKRITVDDVYTSVARRLSASGAAVSDPA